MSAKRSLEELQYLQAMPLNIKIRLTKQRIREFVDFCGGADGVYISFSGGKDSTVLLTIAREMYPNIKAVFVDTGLEYPEIREFVKTWDNVDWVKPKMTFKQVIEKYGYPMISKEVSECVWGARRFLTSVIEQQNALVRQTDRQTDRHPYSYFYERLCGLGVYAKDDKGGDGQQVQKTSWYRRIQTGRSIGSPQRTISKRSCKNDRQLQGSAADGNSAEDNGKSDSGEYP